MNGFTTKKETKIEVKAKYFFLFIYGLLEIFFYMLVQYDFRNDKIMHPYILDNTCLINFFFFLQLGDGNYPGSPECTSN